YASQAFLLRRLQKLFDLRQYIFGDALKITRRFHFSNLLSHCLADLFARGNSRGCNLIRPLQAAAHYAQVSSASPTILARLSFLRTADGTIHGSGLYGSVVTEVPCRAEYGKWGKGKGESLFPLPLYPFPFTLHFRSSRRAKTQSGF